MFRGVPGCYGLVPGFTDTLEVASQRGFKVHQVTVGRAMWSKRCCFFYVLVISPAVKLSETEKCNCYKNTITAS